MYYHELVSGQSILFKRPPEKPTCVLCGKDSFYEVGNDKLGHVSLCVYCSGDLDIKRGVYKRGVYRPEFERVLSACDESYEELLKQMSSELEKGV